MTEIQEILDDFKKDCPEASKAPMLKILFAQILACLEEQAHKEAQRSDKWIDWIEKNLYLFGLEFIDNDRVILRLYGRNTSIQNTYEGKDIKEVMAKAMKE